MAAWMKASVSHTLKICRVAEAYETLKPQLPHSAPCTPLHSKENLYDPSQSKVSSNVAVAPLQDASNRLLADPQAVGLLPRPGSAPGLGSIDEALSGHLGASKLSYSSLQERSVSRSASAAATVRPMQHHELANNSVASATQKTEPSSMQKIQGLEASTNPGAIAAVHGTETEAQDPGPTAVQSLTEVAKLPALADKSEASSPDKSTIQVATRDSATNQVGAPAWFPQWFQEAFVNAHGSSLATIAMPNMQASISSHAPGVTVLAAHANSDSTTACNQLSLASSNSTSPQPGSAATAPQAAPQTAPHSPHVVLVASTGDSSRSNSSRGASPSPQLPRPPLRKPAPVGTSSIQQCAGNTAPPFSATNANAAADAPHPHLQVPSADTATGADHTHRASSAPDRSDVQLHTAIPTTAHVCGFMHEEHNSTSILAAKSAPGVHVAATAAATQDHAPQDRAQRQAVHVPAATEAGGAVSSLEAPKSSVLGPTTLSTYQQRPASYEPEHRALPPTSSGFGEGSRRYSADHASGDAHAFGLGARGSRAASPSLRSLPEDSFRASEPVSGAAQEQSNPPYACCEAQRVQCGACPVYSSHETGRSQQEVPVTDCKLKALHSYSLLHEVGVPGQRSGPHRHSEEEDNHRFREHTHHESILATAVAQVAEGQQCGRDVESGHTLPHHDQQIRSAVCHEHYHSGEARHGDKFSSKEQAWSNVGAWGQQHESHHVDSRAVDVRTHSSDQQIHHRCATRSPSSEASFLPQHHSYAQASKSTVPGIHGESSWPYSHMQDAHASRDRSEHTINAESSAEDSHLHPAGSPRHVLNTETSSVLSDGERWLEDSSEFLPEESSASLAGSHYSSLLY